MSDQVPEVMVKVNINLYFTPEQAVKAQRGNRRIALFFVLPRRSVMVGGQRHSPTALPQGKRPGSHCTGGWVDPMSSMN
jgi:hypothetical protein